MAPSERGPAQRFLVGSRVQRLAARTERPLVIARDPPRRGLRVAAGTDFSPASEHAVAFAARLAARLGGSLDLVFVAHVPRSVAVVAGLLGSAVTVEGVRARGEMNLAAMRTDLVARVAPGLECRAHVATGPVAETFDRLLRDIGADLTVVAPAGAGGRLPGLVGSTVLGLIQRLPTSLCLAPAAG